MGSKGGVVTGITADLEKKQRVRIASDVISSVLYSQLCVQVNEVLLTQIPHKEYKKLSNGKSLL